eukprot:2076935-Lingulodinium_polyedra.AAC.1
MAPAGNKRRCQDPDATCHSPCHGPGSKEVLARSRWAGKRAQYVGAKLGETRLPAREAAGKNKSRTL